MQAISTRMHFLFLCLFLGLFDPCLTEHTFQVYARIPENGNKVCQSEDMAFSKTAVSATVCCSLCQVSAACMIGVFYNSETRRCTGCTKIQPSLVEDQGTIYFQAVSRDTNTKLSTPSTTSENPRTTAEPMATEVLTVTSIESTSNATPTTSIAPTTTSAAPTTSPTTTSIAPTTTSAAPTPPPTMTSEATTTTSAALTTTTTSSTSINPTSSTVTTPSTTTVESLTGVRLVNGSAPNEGRLEIKHYYDENKWRGVQLVFNRGTWTWEATQVVCRQLGFHFGGSYHKVNKPFPASSYRSYEFRNIACVGNETTIFDCPVDSFEKESFTNKNLGITCFTYNVNLSGYGNIHLVYDGNFETTGGHIEISYTGQWTYVCGELMNKAPDVFCATISNGTLIADQSGYKSDSSLLGWTRNINCRDDTVPHPFFCLNEGWHLENCNTYTLLSCKNP